MEHQVAEITPETCGAICHWMERVMLGVPPTYVTYRAEYVPAVTGRMVLCTVAVLPHPSLTRVCAQYRASFESGTFRLLPRDYWRLAPLVDGVPSYEGI
jgi:hypothetical protein